jgi:hypothetical protein
MYNVQSREIKAEPLKRKAAETEVKVHGEKHPDVLTAIAKLGIDIPELRPIKGKGRDVETVKLVKSSVRSRTLVSEAYINAGFEGSIDS